MGLIHSADIIEKLLDPYTLKPINEAASRNP